MSSQSRPARILVVDDNPEIHRDLTKCLAATSGSGQLGQLERELFGAPASVDVKTEYELTYANQGEAGVAACRSALEKGFLFTLAVVDMRMPPGIDGLETIERLWKIDPALQVILCTAFSDYSWKQISARLGRRDNLLVLRKPFEQIEVQQMAMALSEKRRAEAQARMRLEELERIVSDRTAELQEARRRDQERMGSLEVMVDRRTTELRRAALHDRLTGLPNRGYFAESVNAAIARASTDTQSRYAVLFLDCDRFKIVNDSLGHACGDLLLIEMARRLTSACEADERVAGVCERAMPARLGGDEFAILMAGIRAWDHAMDAARRVMEILETPARIHGHDLRLIASIGVATSEHAYSRAEEAIRDADTAMYKAKAAGGARVVAFTPEMHADAMHRLVLENDLRKAIEADRLEVHYQPIVDLCSGEILALEALSRWNHPTAGPISPVKYIPLAEETGLIQALGQQTLRKSCLQLAAWTRELPAGRVPSVSINVSRLQLTDAGFADRVQELLEETKLDPSRIVLEITESTVMEHMDLALEILARCRKMGLGVYMDDFGTGHSSLSCLQQFPLTGLKIDRSFLGGDRSSKHRSALVEAIITVAHKMHIPAIAEGVETVEDVAWLQGLGCERGQGFFFSQPVPASAVTELLRQPGSWIAFDGVQRFLDATRAQELLAGDLQRT